MLNQKTTTEFTAVTADNAAELLRPGNVLRSMDFEPRPGVGDCYYQGTILRVDSDRGVVYFDQELVVWRGEEERTGPPMFAQLASTPMFGCTREWPGRLSVAAGNCDR